MAYIPNAQIVTITQAAHGFVAGNVLKFTAGVYSKAQATTAANAEVVGIVASAPTANSFIIQHGGYMTGLAGLTANSVHYLSAATAGLLTITEPTANDQISKPLLIADSTSSGYLFNFRGIVIGNTNPSTKTLIYGLMGA